MYIKRFSTENCWEMTFNFSFLHGGFVCLSYLVDLLRLQVSERTNYPYERLLITPFKSQAACTGHGRFKIPFFLSTTTLWNDISFDLRCLVLSQIYWLF